jgi:hypothetical protein
MKKIYHLFIITIFTIFINSLNAQDDLLSEIEEETIDIKFYNPAFKAMKICNLQSTKVAEKGDVYMYISHRFASVQEGISTFFGLDNANTKIQLVYGLLDGLQVGLSRESLRRTYAGHFKLRLLKQKDQSPVNITLYSTININTLINNNSYEGFNKFDRFSYATQLLISRKINDNISIEIAPSYVRQNLVYELNQSYNQFVLGAGARFKISKRSSINVDYAYNFDRANPTIYQNPLTIGMDIETGGHVFQLMFSNAQSTNEPGFLSMAEGNWKTGDVFFGFNIVRVF